MKLMEEIRSKKGKGLATKPPFCICGIGHENIITPNRINTTSKCIFPEKMGALASLYFLKNVIVLLAPKQ